MQLSNLDNLFQNSKPQIDIDDLKRRFPVSTVVSQHVDLKRSCRELIGLCPFHHEKTPSFTVNDDKAFAHCFGCGWHGDVIAFVQEYEGIEFLEAVERLQSGLPSSPQVRTRTVAELGLNRVRKEEENRKEPKKRDRAQEIWRNHTPLWEPEAELGVVYLRDVRGIEPPYPETIGFGHLAYPESELILPALITARHDPADHDHVAGVQRIFLQENGQKYQGKRGAKLSLGSIPGGRSRLINPFPLIHLLLAEGVETTLSGHRLFGGDDIGAWSMCGGFPKSIALPDTVEEVLLVADADAHGGSQQKAETLAEWIRSTGRKAMARVPKFPGRDANDVLQGRRHGI